MGGGWHGSLWMPPCRLFGGTETPTPQSMLSCCPPAPLPASPPPPPLPSPPARSSDWDRLGEHMASYDEQREVVIKKCRGG